MAQSRQTIRAVYKDGVLRPLEPLDLPEESTVEVTVDTEGVGRRLDELFSRVHKRNENIPIEEIEKDIDEVIREVRRERRGGGGA